MTNLINRLVELRDAVKLDNSFALLDETIRKLEYYNGYENGFHNRKKSPQKQRKPVTAVDSSVSDFLKTFQNIDGQISKRVYLAYVDYCEGLKITPLSHIEFSRQVCRILQAVTVPKRFNKDNVSRVFETGSRL